MWRLARLTFWLSVVFLLLPAKPPSKTMSTTNASTSHVSASEALSAAASVLSDMHRFCVRQPEACAVGSQLIVQLGQQTEVDANRLYEFLREQNHLDDRGVVNARIPARGATQSATLRVSHDTLTSGDLTIPWHGPQLSDRTVE